MDRGGTEQATNFTGHDIAAPRLSPDGRRVAAIVMNGETDFGDIWVYDLLRGTLSRLTSDENHGVAIWTPDGRRLTFRSGPPGAMNIYWMWAMGAVRKNDC